MFMLAMVFFLPGLLFHKELFLTIYVSLCLKTQLFSLCNQANFSSFPDMVSYIATLMFWRWEVCGSEHVSKSLIRVIISDLWLLAKKRNGNQWNHKISLAFLPHLWGYNVSAIINIFHCSKCFQHRTDSRIVSWHYCCCFPGRSPVPSNGPSCCSSSVWTAHPRQVHGYSICFSLSRMDLFLPHLLKNVTLFKIPKGICLF